MMAVGGGCGVVYNFLMIGSILLLIKSFHSFFSFRDVLAWLLFFILLI
jgi:hypothetical protein